MTRSPIPILDKILNTIDSDDIQILALSIEANLTKVKTGKLKKMLKSLLLKNKLNTEEANIVRRFLSFM